MQQRISIIFLPTLVVAWLFMIYEYVLRVSDSVIVNHLMQSLQIGPGAMSVLSSGFYIPYVLMQVPAGLLLDRYDVKKIWPFALLSVTIGSFLFAISHTIELATIARVFMGIGSAFAWVSIIKIIVNHLRESYHNFTIGLSMTLAMLGAIIGQAPWLLITNHLGSWQAPYYIFAGIGIVLLLIALFFAKNINGPSRDVSLKSIGILKQILPAFKGRNFWILVIFIGVLSSPQTAFTALWGVEFFHQSYHFSREAAASLLSMIWFGGLFGGPVLGIIADSIKDKKWLLIAINGLTILLMLIIIYVQPHIHIVVASILFFIGLLTNGNIIIFAMTSRMTQALSKGAIVGVTNMFNMAGGPIFQMLIGGILSSTMTAGNIGNFSIALSVIPIALFLTLLSLFWYRR